MNEINESECDLGLENINVDCYFDFDDNGYDYAPQHPPPPRIFLKFIGIIFYVFGYLKECEFDIFGDLNYVENRLELEFENANYGGLCNGYDYPPQTAVIPNGIVSVIHLVFQTHMTYNHVVIGEEYDDESWHSAKYLLIDNAS